jgi:hypothetical protein
MTRREAVPPTLICSLALAPTHSVWYFAGSGFRGKEFAWTSEMRPHAGKVEFGGAVGGIRILACNRLRLEGKERFS